MIKYTIFENNMGLACEKRNETQKGYITSESVFKDLLAYVMSSNYRIKIRDKDVFLCHKDFMLKLKDFEQIRDYKLLEELKRDIMHKIRREGFVDLTERGYSGPKRLKRNEQEIKIIKACTELVAIAGITVSIISYKAKPTPKEIPNETSHIVETVTPKATTLSYEIPTEKANRPSKPTSYMDREISMPIPIKEAYLPFDDLSSEPKAINAKNNYFDTISNAAHRFGLDKNILLGIATQERGIHSDKIDEGGGLGLMQIQYDVWIGSTIDYYELNEETNTFERKSIKITDDLLKSLEGNIFAGSIILQQCMRISNYNIPMAIQMYNQGRGAINTIVDTYAKANNKEKEDVINNPEDFGWLDYRYLKKGDPNYLENVMKWIDEDTFTVTNTSTNEEISFRITNQKGVQM